MPENDLEQELRDIVRESIPPVVFPDVQRVIVENQPEPVINVTVPEVKIPEITVPEPKVTVNVPEPKVVTDNSDVVNAVQDLKRTIESRPETSNQDVVDALEDIAEKLDKPAQVQSSGWLPVVDAIDKQNYISTLNSTTTALNNGQTFTGTWEDALKYDSVVVAAKTDQNGTFTIQFSPDGTNADSTLTRYYRTTQIEAPHRFTVTRRYFRVTFTNDSGANQTYFRLQTLLGSKAELNAPTDSVLAQDFDATVVRPTDYHYEVALGRRQGATTWNKFGYNADVDIGTEVIAAFGGSFTPLTTASTLTIVSSSASDDGDPAGTGAHSIVIIGVDANRKAQTEVVTLNGITNVVTSTTWLGINRAAVYVAGSSLGNVGNITITATTGGTTQAYIPAGQGTTQQLIFFTQADHQALADWMVLNAARFNVGTEPIVTFKGWVFSAVSNAKYEVFRQIVDCNIDDHIELSPTQPFIIGEKSCFWIEATTQVNDTSVSGRFSLIEVRDVDA